MGKCVFWLACVLLLVVANGAASGGKKQPSVPGGLHPIRNISDPKYQSLGKLVVEIYNWQTGSNLQFVKVVCGWQRSVRGINYKFCLKLVDNDNNNAVVHYRTSVYLDPSINIFIDDFYLVPVDLECCFPEAQGKAKA